MRLKKYEYNNSENNDLKSGTLRFFGDWFGRPYDNIHYIISITANNNMLKIVFNEDEILYVHDPSKITINKNELCIKSATKVRWEWYSYGKEKIDNNKYFVEYINTNRDIIGNTNVDWYIKKFEIDRNQPAVKIY